MISPATRVFYAELHRGIGQPWRKGSELRDDDAASLSWERVVGTALARTRTYRAGAHRPVSVVEYLARALSEGFVAALPPSIGRPSPQEGATDHDELWSPIAVKVLAAAQAEARVGDRVRV